MLLSDCGKYIAIGHKLYSGFDVIAVDGSCIWLWRRYQPKGWEDKDPRHTHAEFEHEVYSISNHSYENRNGKHIHDYIIGFGDMDTAKKVKPFTGNTVIKSYSARFRTPIKRLAWKYKPKKQ